MLISRCGIACSSGSPSQHSSRKSVLLSSGYPAITSMLSWWLRAAGPAIATTIPPCPGVLAVCDDEHGTRSLTIDIVNQQTGRLPSAGNTGASPVGYDLLDRRPGECEAPSLFDLPRQMRRLVGRDTQTEYSGMKFALFFSVGSYMQSGCSSALSVAVLI